MGLGFRDFGSYGFMGLGFRDFGSYGFMGLGYRLGYRLY